MHSEFDSPVHICQWRLCLVKNGWDTEIRHFFVTLQVGLQDKYKSRSFDLRFFDRLKNHKLLEFLDFHTALEGWNLIFIVYKLNGLERCAKRNSVTPSSITHTNQANPLWSKISITILKNNGWKSSRYPFIWLEIKGLRLFLLNCD